MNSLFRASLFSGLAAVTMAVMPAAHAQDNDWLAQPFENFVLVGGAQSSYMGVNLADIDNDRAHALKLRDVHGVEITRIEDNSPAAKAGLKIGDVVLEYNGQRVEGMEQFGRFVRETPVGREVKLVISRDGNVQPLAVTVGSRNGMRTAELFGSNTPGAKTYHFNMPEVNIPMPDIPMIFQTSRMGILGVEVESLTPQLADFFGVKEGVLVRSVVKDSAAEKAGIKAGDVITKVDQQGVTSPSELSAAIRTSRAKGAFPIQVIREHRELTLNATVEKASREQLAVPRARVVSVSPKM